MHQQPEHQGPSVFADPCCLSERHALTDVPHETANTKWRHIYPRRGLHQVWKHEGGEDINLNLLNLKLL